jgi:hypothetical protein
MSCLLKHERLAANYVRVRSLSSIATAGAQGKGDQGPRLRHYTALIGYFTRTVARSTFQCRLCGTSRKSVIASTFGKSSTNLKNLESARWSGEHNLSEMTEQDLQRNFELRLRAFEVLTRNLIDEVGLHMPDDDIQGAYEPGEQYELYRDLSKIISRATREVMIVDAYLDEQSFNLYVDKASKTVAVRVLSNRVGSNLETVAKMCAAGRTLQLRASPDVHDRALFSDDRGWVLGQSLKDAAKAKPTYLVELTEPALERLRNAHDNVWSSARIIA